jgi:hypothetical protein
MFAAGCSGRPFPVPTKGTFAAALGQAAQKTFVPLDKSVCGLYSRKSYG